MSELARNTVQNTSIMEHDKVTLFPCVRQHILRGVDSALQPVTDAPDLLHITDDTLDACVGVCRGERVNTTSQSLQVWLPVSKVLPYHLKG